MQRPLHGVHTALVTDNQDPAHTGRVRVRFPWLSDDVDHGFRPWARVAAPMAGDRRGLWCMPEVGDEVLVAFEAGDAERAFVLGSLWNGVDRPPVDAGDIAGNDIKTLTTRSGTSITIDDSQGAERIALRTPDGQSVELGVDGGLRLRGPGGNEVVIDQLGITLKGTSLKVETASVTFDAAVVKASGAVEATTLIVDSVVAKRYTPGAGNIW